MIYFVSKLFTYLILPPGIFIAALFAAYFFAKKFKKIFLFLAVLFWFISTDFAPQILLKPLEYKNFSLSKNIPISVVVLGGGEQKGVLSLPTSSGATERILKALLIAYQKNLPLVYSGVEGDSAKKSIEEIVRGFDLDFKNLDSLKPKTFYIEGKSKDTYENAKFTKEFLKQKDIKNPCVILVTSAFHMPRAYKIFKHFGFEVVPVKTDYKVGKFELDFWSFSPQMKNLKKSYLAIHEYFGLLSLIARGIW